MTKINITLKFMIKSLINKAVVYRIKLLLIDFVIFFQKLFFSKTISIKNVVVIVNGGMGDFIMLSPLIYELSKSNININIIAKREITIDIANSILDIKANLQNANNVDLLIFSLGCSPDNLNIIINNFNTRLIGFINSNRIKSNFLSTNKNDFSTKNHIFSNLEILKYLNLYNHKIQYYPIKKSIVSDTIDDLSICINLKSKGHIRNWPLDYYSSLINCIFRDFDNFLIILLGGEDDQSVAEDIKNRFPSQKIENYCGKITITETLAIIANSKLLITGDSGIMHLGFLCGTKTIALFGPTNFENYIIDNFNKYIFSRNTNFCNYGILKNHCKCDQYDSCIYLKEIKPIQVFTKIKELI